MSKPELKTEAIRLRVEERLSLREIVRRTQASKGAVSLWLRPYQLSEEERRSLARKNHYSPATLRKERGVESTLHKVVAGQNLTVFEKMRIAEAAVLLRLTIHRFRVFGPSSTEMRSTGSQKIPTRECVTSSRCGGPVKRETSMDFR